MGKKNTVKRILTALLLLTFLWVVFFITRFVYEKSENTNLNFIPNNANMALRIDGKELIKSSLFSIFFESRDEKTIDKIKEFIESQKFEKVKDNGLNLFSDVVIFSSPLKKGNVIGFSLNIVDRNAFKSTLGKSNQQNQFIEVIDNVGFVLISLNDTEITKSDLSAFFNKNIKKNARKNETFSANENSIFQVFTNGTILGKSTCFNSSKLNIELIESGLQLDGIFKITKSTTENIPSKSLLQVSDNDFHFSSSIITSALQDSLNSILKRMNYSVPDFKSISMNYKGINIISDGSGMHPLPIMDLLIEFKTNFNVSDFFENAPFVDQIEGEFSNNQLKIAGFTYYINQINSTTVSIGSTKNLEIIENKKQELFSVKGNLSSVLKIKGGGMIVSFIEVVPLFKSSKELFGNVEKFDITLIKETPQKAQVNGKLIFKKGHSTLNEIIKFSLVNKDLLNEFGLLKN